MIQDDTQGGVHWAGFDWRLQHGERNLGEAQQILLRWAINSSHPSYAILSTPIKLLCNPDP
jgi:hypothetical protein